MAYIAGNVSVTETNRKNKLRVYIKDGGGASFDMAQTDIDTLLAYLTTNGFKKIGYCSAYPTFENSYGDAIENNEGGESGGMLTFTATASQIGIDDATWASVVCLHETKVTMVYLDPDTGVVREFKNITLRVYDSSDDGGQEMITYDMYKKASNVNEFETRNTLAPSGYVGAITGYVIDYAGTDLLGSEVLAVVGSGTGGAASITWSGTTIESITIDTAGIDYINGETWLALVADGTTPYSNSPVIRAIVDYGC